MTTISKEDIKHMRPKQRNKYRRLGFTWAEIKKIDRAIGRGETTITLKTTAGEVTLTLPPAPDRTPEARDQA
ncbi:hypothetical protein [Streptomyces cucumeris]|uniref:hypothetical protein n=1 Tax=Streptomyces cucumeris TaxID=2962890 RepID=UPI0020C8E7EF|nr:hypothetical protein [Streptomyces sp. NEAU-Y11]MCP9213275.1 hypothetical protein [Streptomyces sp. NEAU-Y11]